MIAVQQVKGKSELAHSRRREEEEDNKGEAFLLGSKVTSIHYQIRFTLADSVEDKTKKSVWAYPPGEELKDAGSRCDTGDTAHQSSVSNKKQE